MVEPGTNDADLEEALREIEHQRAAFKFPVFNCAMRDDLAALAREGDRAALEALLAAMPRDIRSDGRRRFRDAELRRLAVQLRAELPDLADYGIATMLADAGATIEAGGGLGAVPPFDGLGSSEREALRRSIARLIRYTGPMLKWRQILTIIG